MSIVRTGVARVRAWPPVTVIACVGAAWFLLARPSFASLGRSAVPTLGAGYLVLGLTSASAVAVSKRSAPDAARARDPWIPLALGVAAVLIARAAAGPAPPLRASLAAVALGTGAAVAEEAFFRGFLFGRLERWSVGVAVAGSASAFALMHLPLYGWTAFPVDLGAGLLLAWQRAASGRWTVPAGTHALANLLAVLR